MLIDIEPIRPRVLDYEKANEETEENTIRQKMDNRDAEREIEEFLGVVRTIKEDNQTEKGKEEEIREEEKRNKEKTEKMNKEKNNNHQVNNQEKVYIGETSKKRRIDELEDEIMKEIREEDKKLQKQIKEIGFEETLRKINKEIERENQIEKQQQQEKKRKVDITEKGITNKESRL